MEPRRLGQILIAEGLISDDQLEAALGEAKNGGISLLQAMTKLEIIEETPLANFLAHQFGLETVDLVAAKPNPQIKTVVHPEIARRLRLVPFAADKKTLKLAVENPGEADTDEIKRTVRVPAGVTMQVFVAPVSQITAVIDEFYPAKATGLGAKGEITSIGGITVETGASGQPQKKFNPLEQETVAELDPNALIAEMNESLEVGSGEAAAEEYSVADANAAPVIRLCNYIISEAVNRRVSDIHINPTAKGLTVRYRVDGALSIMPSPPPQHKQAVIARFKIMAKMNITERRKPQDGRIKIRVHDKVIDLRVSVIPQMDGENIVMRILDQSSLNLDLKKLGFEPAELDKYNECIRAPYGMILHTGPTGSGKTTTLYSALSTIFDPKKCFITLEDPVEYEMPGIVQVQMDHEAGMDFGVALRSALRQDPNIMMVGEIRDKETASIAISAALTGHLLFSTLHTNDAPSTITRFIDIGIEPVYVATAVRLIVAQRLMRRVCQECKQPAPPTKEELESIDLTMKDAEGGTFFKGTGCAKCNLTGYKGRVACYEIMPITTQLQDLIYSRADNNHYRSCAEEQGMRSLRTLAISKWMAGMSTVEEIKRVTLGGD
jgi:type IV pilus assembly protein PilB